MEIRAEKGPFGGFCNFGNFVVIGKDAQTGKRKLKKLSAVSQEAAEAAAAAFGVVAPYEVSVEALREPTDRQLSCAEKLGLDIPAGCCLEDVGALLDREEKGDWADVDPGLIAYAESRGVCFSRLSSTRGLLGCMISQLGVRDRAILFAYAAHVGGGSLSDPRESEALPAFERFADMVECDRALAKSLEGRDVLDYLSPNKGTKAYKTAASCF